VVDIQKENLFPDTNASVPAVTTLKSFLIIFVVLVYNTFVSFIALFAEISPWRLSE
jgi:hypothetical protein